MPRQATIPIYDGNDAERLAELRREVSIAERNVLLAKRDADSAAAGPAARFGDNDLERAKAKVAECEETWQAAKDTYDAFVTAAAERAEEWVLHAIGHEDFRALLAEHPPRKVTEGEGDEAKEVDHPEDEGWGFDTSTFGKALLLWRDPDDADHRTVVKPALKADALEKRVKRLAAGEFAEMWQIAESLNSGRIADPKASRYSATDPR
jgi:hypothetical protein